MNVDLPNVESQSDEVIILGLYSSEVYFIFNVYFFYMSQEIIAIIPARGGSKRIPRKNIRHFCGQPIIKYSIDAALEAECFDEVMVSTEDTEIAEIAKLCGAKVPFMRSEVNSSDHAILDDVMKEVLMEYINNGKHFEYFCCILPTNPLISAERLKEGLKLLKETNADGVLAVAPFHKPVLRSLKIDNGFLTMLFPENYTKRSQDLETVYYDSGQFYFMKSRSKLNHNKHFPKNIVPLVLKKSEVQDIDDEEDWIKTEQKYAKIRKNRNE